MSIGNVEPPARIRTTGLAVVIPLTFFGEVSISMINSGRSRDINFMPGTVKVKLKNNSGKLNK
jgi:hypothetical protein